MKTERKIIFSADAPAPIGPYSQAVLVGNTLYASGQIALDPKTSELVLSDIEAETEQVMKNMEAVLKAADMNFENIIKCTIFIKNMGDFARINAVYGKSFPQNPPARETVEVACLPKNVNVEISCIAIS
jgi:2-iminobutanoate/2-iminopropanoate deaminase